MKTTIPPYRVPGVRGFARAAVGCVAALLAALVSAATAAEPATAPAAAAASYPPDLPARALAALDVKCAACHGPQLTKPKKFGYVTDLPRMAANPKLVVPFRPEASSLWTSIEEGDMPPEDAKTGQLTPDEKEAIRQWIVVGAPPLPPGTGPTTHPAVAAAAPEPPPLSLPKRLVRLTGRLHPLVVHFPIAMLVAAAMAEVIWLVTRQEWLAPAIRFCVLVGCTGAVVGGALGWINALTHSSSQTLTNHAILGTVAAVWAIPIVFLSERVVRRAGPNAGRRERVRLPFQVVLFLGVLILSVAAHIGGELVYGEDYFRL